MNFPDLVINIFVQKESMLSGKRTGVRSLMKKNSGRFCTECTNDLQSLADESTA